MPPRGAGSYSAFYEESTPGTANTTTADARPIRLYRGSKIVEEIEEVESEEFADDAQGFASDTYQGTRSVSGDYTMNPMYGSFGWVWYGLLGASSTQADTPSSGRHTHTYEPGADVPSWTVIESTGDAWQETFLGVKMNTGTLTWERGRRINLALSLIGMSSNGRVTSGLTSHTLPSATRILSKHLSAAPTWNSQAYTCDQLTLTIENNLEEVPTVESDTPGAIEQGETARRVTVSMRSRMVGAELYNANRAQTVADFSLTLTDGTDTLSFALDDTRIIEYDEEKDRNGVLYVSWTIQGVASGSDKGITITAVNDDADATQA